MSCCNGNCNCGSSCKCGTSGGGCKKYPEMSYVEGTTTTQTVVMGVAPQSTFYDDGAETGVAAENGGCKCEPDCKCNPCNCKGKAPNES